MKVGIADVAKKAKVSACTVSRVLNNTYSHKVGEATRQRVLEAAKELNYRPNIIARGLRKRQSTLIGVLLPDVVGSFIADIVQGIQDASEAMGFSTILYTTQGNSQKIEHYTALLLDKQIDGLLIYEPFHNVKSATLRQLMDSGIPVVSLLFESPDGKFPTVLVDQREGAVMATKHLLAQGHRHLFHLAGETGDQHGVDRRQGFEETIAASGENIAYSIVEVGWDWKMGYEATKRQYRNTTNSARPTGIFACSDAVALGAMKALHELGLKIPEEVSVVGFDDLPFAELAYPGLTTIAQPKYQVGEQGMKLLLKQIEGDQGANVLLPPALVFRESTAPARP